MSLDAVPSMLFVDEDSGAYIDLVGAQYYNITRRAGTRAYCDVRFTGEAGLVIGQGTRFLTAGGLGYALLEQVTLNSAGSGTGRLEAEAVGSGYNVDAGSVSRMYVNLPGLASLAAAGSSFPKSPIWSVGQCLMVHLLCFKYLLFWKKTAEENGGKYVNFFCGMN